MELVSFEPVKLSFNFVEEAGVRCFETEEFDDWYEAIRAVLLESNVNLSTEVISDLFNGLPESADDEIFELSLKAYLIDKKLLTKDKVESEEWDFFFSSAGEVDWVDEGALPALHSDAALKGRLENTHGQIGDQMAS